MKGEVSEPKNKTEMKETETQKAIPQGVLNQIADKGVEYYKDASIGNKFKTMHELGFNRGGKYGYQLGRSKFLEEKEKEISDLQERCISWAKSWDELKGERDAFAYNADQYDKQLQESLLLYQNMVNTISEKDSRIRELEEALRELVDLKNYKDYKGKDDYYLAKQPKVWKKAQNILNNH